MGYDIAARQNSNERRKWRAGLTAGVLPAALCSTLPHDETEMVVPRLLISTVGCWAWGFPDNILTHLLTCETVAT